MPRRNRTKSSGQPRKVTQPRRPKVLANNAAPVVRRPKAKKSKMKKGGTAIKPHHIRGVCSITDPFCPAAKGSKFPDGTVGNTMTEQFRGNQLITTNAAGCQLFYMNPGMLPYGYGLGVGAGAGTLAMPATWTALKTGSLFESFGKQYRVVSAGAIIRCVASATDASGLATFGSCPAIPINTVITLGTELYVDSTIKAIQPGMEMSWISSPQGTEARAFVPAGLNTSFLSEWTSLLIEVSGAPSGKGVLNVEWFINIEFQITTNSAIAAVARANPPQVTHATTAVSQIQTTLGSFVEGGIHTVEDKVYNAASSALNSLLNDPLDALAGLFGM